jgi:CRP-like cAMP-binding protein
MSCGLGAYAKICPMRAPTGASGRCRSAKGCRRQRLDPALVADLPIFEKVPVEVLGDLLGTAMIESHGNHAMLFEAGDPADAFYILLAGRVKLFALLEDGKESIVEVVEPVSSFAEGAMFASGHYPVSAEVIEDAALVRVRAEPFLAGLKQNRDLACRMLSALGHWNRHLRREVRTLREHSPIRRVSGFLLSLIPCDEGPASVALPLKKVIIASRLGMEPESLSRVLGRLRAVGVRTAGNTVHVEDVARLRRLYLSGEDAPVQESEVRRNDPVDGAVGAVPAAETGQALEKPKKAAEILHFPNPRLSA